MSDEAKDKKFENEEPEARPPTTSRLTTSRGKITNVLTRATTTAATTSRPTSRPARLLRERPLLRGNGCWGPGDRALSFGRARARARGAARSPLRAASPSSASSAAASWATTATSPSPASAARARRAEREQRRARSRPGPRTGRAAPSPAARSVSAAAGRAPAARRAPPRRRAAAPPSALAAHTRSPRRRRGRSADRVCTSSSTSGVRDESTQPAMPVRRRQARADQLLLALAGDGREDELVGLLVEEEDRRRLRAEDRARDLDDRPEQLRELLLRREHAGGDGGLERQPSSLTCPPTFEESGTGRSSAGTASGRGCLLRISAAMPEMHGVAKLLPVARIVPPPSHATSTSTPRAKNSTGGSGFA